MILLVAIDQWCFVSQDLTQPQHKYLDSVSAVDAALALPWASGDTTAAYPGRFSCFLKLPWLSISSCQMDHLKMSPFKRPEAAQEALRGALPWARVRVASYASVGRGGEGRDGEGRGAIEWARKGGEESHFLTGQILFHLVEQFLSVNRVFMCRLDIDSWTNVGLFCHKTSYCANWSHCHTPARMTI